MVDKSTEKALLQYGLNLATKQNRKASFESLRELEFDLKLYKGFQRYLLNKYRDSINEET